MNSKIIPLLIACLAILACSGSETDVAFTGNIAGKYSITKTTCSFTTSESTFTVGQSGANLNVAFNTYLPPEIAPVVDKSINVVPPKSNVVSDPLIIQVANATISGSGNISAAISVPSATYQCAGSFEENSDIKTIILNCSKGTENCQISAANVVTEILPNDDVKSDGNTPKPNL